MKGAKPQNLGPQNHMGPVHMKSLSTQNTQNSLNYFSNMQQNQTQQNNSIYNYQGGHPMPNGQHISMMN